jgi:hypothetical protein
MATDGVSGWLRYIWLAEMYWAGWGVFGEVGCSKSQTQRKAKDEHRAPNTPSKGPRVRQFTKLREPIPQARIEQLKMTEILGDILAVGMVHDGKLNSVQPGGHQQSFSRGYCPCPLPLEYKAPRFKQQLDETDEALAMVKELRQLEQIEEEMTLLGKARNSWSCSASHSPYVKVKEPVSAESVVEPNPVKEESAAEPEPEPKSGGDIPVLLSAGHVKRKGRLGIIQLLI